MSDSENKKVQDILREVAADDNRTIPADVIDLLAQKLGIFETMDTPSYSRRMRICLSEIADRIDKQSVVEVQVPPRAEKTEYDGVTTELEALTPAIIDVHDCIIDIRIEASDD